MTIKEEMQTIIDQRNFLDDKDFEKQLGFLVWEVKREMLNKARELLKENEDYSPNIDKFLIQLDGAVK